MISASEHSRIDLTESIFTYQPRAIYTYSDPNKFFPYFREAQVLPTCTSNFGTTSTFPVSSENITLHRILQSLFRANSTIIMPAPSMQITIDELTARFATLSLRPRKRGLPKDPWPYDSSVPKRRRIEVPKRRKPTQLLKLDGLPRELILMIFRELFDCCDSAADPLRAVHPLATTSKYFYSCYKENEFAIFRRGINNSLEESLSNSAIDMTPAFCDLVIRVGLLRSAKPWPTCPEKIQNALDFVDIARSDAYTRTRKGFTSAEHNQFKPLIYRDILAWVRVQLFVTRDQQSKPRIDFARRAIKRSQHSPGMPYIPLRTIHPCDAKFPHEPRSRHLSKVTKPRSKAHSVYLIQLNMEWGKYNRHYKEPWTEAETQFLASRQYIPCCQMDLCPRRMQASA